MKYSGGQLYQAGNKNLPKFHIEKIIIIHAYRKNIPPGFLYITQTKGYHD